MKSNQQGFTLTELLIIMGLFSVLSAFITINLIKPQTASSSSSTLYTLVTDIKAQQLKSMAGATESAGTKTPYGIYFTPSSYVLFKGATYNPIDSNNFVVTLDPTTNFNNISFTGSTLVFSTVSGEFSGYTAATDSIDIVNNVNGEVKTLVINRYGTVEIQ